MTTYQIPLRVRLTRLWNDIKQKIPFFPRTEVSEEGKVLIIHLKNMYDGSEAYSEEASVIVQKVMEETKLKQKEAIANLFLAFYSYGVIDELELYRLLYVK